MAQTVSLQPLFAHSPQRTPVARSEGAQVVLADGSVLLECDEISVCLGNGHPQFTQEMNRALDAPLFGDYPAAQSYQSRLTELLGQSTNGDFNYIHLADSGSECAEWAVRLSKKRKGRAESLSFWNSIHGRTYLSASMSGLSRRKAGHGPLAQGVLIAPYPYCYRCPFGRRAGECRFRCLSFLDEKLQNESCDSLACVIVEPIQAGGVIIPPPGYLAALKTWCAQRDADLIFDEVQCGFGRTGSVYRYQQEGVTPDMLLLGKGFSNGMHTAALLIAGQAPQNDLGAMRGGAGDYSLGCAAACAVYDALECGLLARVREAGEQFGCGLRALKEKYPCIGDVRGVGVWWAAELVCCDETRAPNHALATQVLSRLGRTGVHAGSWNSTILLRPPFVITPDQIDLLLERLDLALADCT